jgi:hypothetical protein
MSERRYTEKEVRRIIELATNDEKARPASLARRSGLTLAEIRSIGIEVGLDPVSVENAAARLDALPPRPLRRSLGQPIETGRIVPLPRALTDREWAQLVGELRTTFAAQGKVAVHGEMREWWNGNLRATVEPAGEGYRLRLGTVKGDAQGVNALGVTGLAASALSYASLLASGELASAFVVPILFAAGGVGAFVANLVRLPRWARERTEQMEHIARRVQAMMGAAGAQEAGSTLPPAEP